MKAIGYVRVSTGAQAEDGLSLDLQGGKFRAWAELNDAEVLGLKSDPGRSGGRYDNRPGIQEAIAIAIEHKAVLVVYSLSRLARSTADAIEIADRLGKAGADLVSITEKIDTTTAAGKMIFTVIAALAEFERALISERATEVSSWLKDQGRLRGGTPYGYDVAEGGHLVVNLTERGVVKMITELRLRGSTYQQIADFLNSSQIATKRRGKWYARTVQRIATGEAA